MCDTNANCTSRTVVKPRGEAFVIFPKLTVLYKSVVGKFNFKNHAQECSDISWFALSRKKAEYYSNKNSDAKVIEFVTKKSIKLFNVDTARNLELFSKKINSVQNDQISVLYDKDFSEIKYPEKFNHYSYLKLTIKEKAVYEYKFAFGFLTVREQMSFVKLVLKLQEYGIIKNIRKMNTNILIDNSFIQRLSRILITYTVDASKLEEYGHRFSLYEIDLNVTHNLCKAVRAPSRCDGYITCLKQSIWHKEMLDTSEAALFKTSRILTEK